MDCSTPVFPVPHRFLELAQTYVHRVGDAIQPSHPLLSPSPPPSIRIFSSESALHIRWPKYWSFSFNISPSNEHPGLICFKMDWLDLLVVQGTLKNLLQHHCSKTSVLPMNIHDWSPLGWTGWISLQSKELWGVFSNTTAQKHQFFGAQNTKY